MRSIADFRRCAAAPFVVAMIAFAGLAAPASANPEFWQFEWPNTDFSKYSVAFSDIISGGPPKDGIPSIDNPAFAPHAEVTDIADTEPVISLSIAGEARAYPLQILMWHEIVNDTIGNVPVTVTYCPLCNSAISLRPPRRRSGARFRHHRQAAQLRSCHRAYPLGAYTR